MNGFLTEGKLGHLGSSDPWLYENQTPGVILLKVNECDDCLILVHAHSRAKVHPSLLSVSRPYCRNFL